MTTATATSTAKFTRLPGGKYSARQNADGTWDVLDVPIFSTITKGTKGAPKDVGKADLETAVAAAREKFSSDSHVSRLNVRHTGGLHMAEPAGFYLPKDVRSFKFGGETRPVVFADLLAVPDAIFRRIDANELPYCSAEIRSWAPLTFGPLALLDTDAPFFEFPNISIGAKESQPEAVRVDGDGLAVGVAFSAGASVALFNFTQGYPDDEEKKRQQSQQASAPAAPQATEGSRPAASQQAPPPPADQQTDPQNVPQPGQPQQPTAAGGGTPPNGQQAAGNPLDKFIEILLPLLVARLAEQAGVSSGGEKASTTEGPVDQPVAAMSQQTNTADAEALRGRVEALEEYRANVEREKVENARFAAGVDRLRAAGHHPTPSLEARLRNLAGSEAAFNALVDTTLELGPKDPDASFGSHFEQADQFPAEVMRFSTEPAKFAAAKKAFLAWRELGSHPVFSSGLTPLDKYLEREVG